MLTFVAGIQWDWEAILLGSPEKFIKAARLWIIPSLKVSMELP